MGLGIYSVVYANILFALIVCILNNLAIRKYLRYRQEYKKTFLIPLLASAVMGAAAWGVCYGIRAVMPAAFEMCIRDSYRSGDSAKKKGVYLPEVYPYRRY